MALEYLAYTSWLGGTICFRALLTALTTGSPLLYRIFAGIDLAQNNAMPLRRITATIDGTVRINTASFFKCSNASQLRKAEFTSI